MKVKAVNRSVEHTCHMLECFSMKFGLEFPFGGRHLPPFRNGAECLLVEMNNVCFGCIGSGLHLGKRLTGTGVIQIEDEERVSRGSVNGVKER